MSLRLKVLLTSLILIGAFLVARVGVVFNGDLKTANILNIGQNIINLKSEDPSKIDSDHDGIPDVDEAYYQTDPFNPDTDGDGYKDGEEIAEGCSPIIPKPNDCQDDHHHSQILSQNITNELGKLITGGLFSGDLKNPQTNNKYKANIELIKNKVVSDLENNLGSKISLGDIKTSDNNLTTVSTYTKNLKNILSQSLLKEGQDKEIRNGLALTHVNDGQKNTVFLKLADSFSTSYQQLLSINIPSDFKSLHLNLTNNINRFANIFNYLADPASDPIAAVLSIDKLLDQLSQTRANLQEINNKISTIRKNATYGAFDDTCRECVPVSILEDKPFADYINESERVRQEAFDSLSKLQEKVLENIRNSGEGIAGNGTISFVRDWRELLEGGQYRGENIFRAILADAATGDNATVCPYLREALAKAYNAESTIPGFNPAKYRLDSLQYFKIENKCTLPDNFNVTDFTKDFRNGGWAVWDKLIEPQNNFFGIIANSIDELDKQRGLEERVNQYDALAGSGFVSKRSACTTGANRICTILGRIETPGKILETTVQRSIDENYSWLTSSDDLGDLTAEMADSLYNSLTQKLDNLSGEKASNTGDFEGGGGTFGGGGASGNFGSPTGGTNAGSADTGTVIQLPPGGLPGLP